MASLKSKSATRLPSISSKISSVKICTHACMCKGVRPAVTTITSHELSHVLQTFCKLNHILRTLSSSLNKDGRSSERKGHFPLRIRQFRTSSCASAHAPLMTYVRRDCAVVQRALLRGWSSVVQGTYSTWMSRGFRLQAF